MNKILVLLITATAFTTNAAMEASKVRFTGDPQYANFCKAVVEDDLRLLKRSIMSKVGLVATSSQGVMRKLISVDGVKCNDLDLVKFAEQRKASHIQAYLTNNE